MEDSAAFDQSLDELGDVDELLDYLKGLDPEEELPRLTLHPYEEQEKAKRDLDDLLSSVDEIVENAMDQAKDALRQARDAARQVRKSSWRSDDGSLEFHFNEPADKQDRAQAADTAAPGGSAVQADSPDHGKSWDVSIDNSDATGKKSWQLSFGYDKEKGGFFAESSSTLDASGGPIPSQGLRGVDVQTVNGDVTIHLLDGADDCIRLEGDVDQLEVKVTDKGVLAIRQGKTASSSFFFLRGLSSADVELYLPDAVGNLSRCPLSTATWRWTTVSTWSGCLLKPPAAICPATFPPAVGCISNLPAATSGSLASPAAPKRRL